MMHGILGATSPNVDALALPDESEILQRSHFGLRSILGLVAGIGFAVYLCYLALRPDPDTPLRRRPLEG